MAAVSHADTDESIDRTLEALRDMVDQYGSGLSGRFTRTPRPMPGPADLRTEQVLSPRDAFYASTEMVPIDDAPDRIAAEFCTPYPPGIPLFVPGERLTDALVDYLKTGAAEDFYVEGCVDQSVRELRVVA
jgi:arginine/lysine/ornithine decarboxylase